MALKRALPPTHPGEILREDVLPALDLSVMQAAAKLGVTRQTLHRIVARHNPRPVTPDMAVRLGKLIGNGARLWLNLQSAYDLWHAERRIDARKIPTLHTTE
jgi:addiction module HigA family antidote